MDNTRYYITEIKNGVAKIRSTQSRDVELLMEVDSNLNDVGDEVLVHGCVGIANSEYDDLYIKFIGPENVDRFTD